MSVKSELIPRERAAALARSLSADEHSFLLWVVDWRIRKDERTPRRVRPGGHDVQQMKVDKGGDLRRRIAEGQMADGLTVGDVEYLYRLVVGRAAREAARATRDLNCDAQTLRVRLIEALGYEPVPVGATR